MRSASAGCTLPKKSNPETSDAVAMISKKTIERASGNGEPSKALRNKPNSGVSGFQKKNFSNRPLTE